MTFFVVAFTICIGVLLPSIVSASELETERGSNALWRVEFTSDPERDVRFFPDRISLFQERTLHSTLARQGVSRRSFLFFRVYDIAFFSSGTFTLESPSYPYALWINYRRSISKDKVDKAMQEGLTRNTSDEQKSHVISQYTQQLGQRLRNVAEGDRLQLIRLERDHALVLIGDNTFALRDAIFLDSLFAIWLSAASVVERGELLGW